MPTAGFAANPVIATLNGAVAMGTTIDTTNGFVTNATNFTTSDGDVLVLVASNGAEQAIPCKAQTAGALKIVPLQQLVTDVGYQSGTPIYAKALKVAI